MLGHYATTPSETHDNQSNNDQAYFTGGPMLFVSHAFSAGDL
jgi:hypothetical protein